MLRFGEKLRSNPKNESSGEANGGSTCGREAERPRQSYRVLDLFTADLTVVRSQIISSLRIESESCGASQSFRIHRCVRGLLKLVAA